MSMTVSSSTVKTSPVSEIVVEAGIISKLVSNCMGLLWAVFLKKAKKFCAFMEPENSSSVTQNLASGPNLINIFIMRSLLTLPTVNINVRCLIF